MAANFCDVFKHKSQGLFLFANSGAFRGHLQNLDWELVARHRPMPTFPQKDIDRQGYALWHSTAEGRSRAACFYGKTA